MPENNNTLNWEDFSEEKLSNLKGQPVVILFWADWCPDCQHIGRVAFSDPKVIESAKNINLLKIDCTDRNDPDVKALKEKYSEYHVPTFVFINKEGEINLDWTLVEPSSAQELILRFEKYKE